MLHNFAFTLRPFRRSDAASLAVHANHRKIWEGVRDYFPHPYSEQDAVQFIDYVLSVNKELELAIDVEGNAVGAIGITLKKDVMRLNGELGYWIGVNYHGKGIVSNAIGQIVDMTFKSHNLLRIYAEVFVNNPASARVLVKNNFTREACLKNAVIKDNQIMDLLIFSKINPNFTLNK